MSVMEIPRERRRCPSCGVESGERIGSMVGLHWRCENKGCRVTAFRQIETDD